MKDDWKVNLKDPEVWKRRLTTAKEIRDQRSRELGWERAQDAYQGKILAETPAADTIVVNFPYAYVSNLLPSVYFSQPRILVRPSKEVFHQSAQMLEPLLNYQIRRMRFAREARRSILDAIVVGHGWAKLGWATKYGEVPGTETGKEPLSPGKKSSTRNIRFRPGTPFFFRVDPRMMLTDPRASCFEEVRWVCQMIYKPYDYLMDDPFIQNKGEIKPGYRMAGSAAPKPISTALSEKTTGESLCLCYEIWDLDSQKVRLLVEGSREWQRDEDWPYPFLDGTPFYFLSSTDGVDDIYPVSPLNTWLDQVDEISKIRTMQLDALYRAAGKFIIQQGAFDNEEIEKLKDPNEHVIIAKDIKGFVAAKTLTLDPNAYICEDRVKRDIMDISGLSELQYGNIPGGRVTATLGLISQKASAIRTKRLVDAIRDWLLDIAGDLALLLGHKMPQPEQIAITTNGAIDWLEVTRQDIQGEFLFDLDVTEMAPLSRESRQKEAVDLVSILSQAPDIAKRRKIYADVLEAYGRTEVDAYLNPEQGPPQDPGFENEMMIQGVEVVPNPQENFGLHLQVHNEFMQTPLYQSIVSSVPAVHAKFSTHLQLTITMANQLGALQQPAASQPMPGGRLGPNAATLEQGRPLATASPPVAPAFAEGE